MVCPGYALSVPHNRLLLLKNATVNGNSGFDNVCKDKQVSIAYNEINSGANTFWVKWDEENNRQLEEMWVDEENGYPVRPWVKLEPKNIAWVWEIQAVFFETNNIRPQWHWAFYDRGTLNYTTGQWSGNVGLIQRDEVDYAIYNFGLTHAISKMATFSPVTLYGPQYLWTRYLQELPPTWNLIGLFTKGYKSQI